MVLILCFQPSHPQVEVVAVFKHLAVEMVELLVVQAVLVQFNVFLAQLQVFLAQRVPLVKVVRAVLHLAPYPLTILVSVAVAVEHLRLVQQVLLQHY
jgi:hypothetical protein